MPKPRLYSKEVLVRLEPRDLALLKLKSLQMGRPIAALIRYAIRRFLALEPPSQEGAKNR